MGIFGNRDEEIKILNDFIKLQKEMNDVLIKRMDLMAENIDNMQSEIMSMAINAIQHKETIGFIISQMSFNDKALKQLSTLLKEPSKNKKK